MADDKDLRARFDALKKSTALPQVQSETDETDELVDRFLRFRSAKPTATSTKAVDQPSEEDQKTLKELLADVPSADQWNVDPLDEKNIQKLIKEAQGLLPVSDEESKKPEGEEDREPEDDGVPPAAIDAKGSPNAADEDADADEALQRILDELDLEEDDGPFTADDKKQDPEAKPATDAIAGKVADIAHAPFELPSTPSTAPVAKADAEESSEGDENIVQLPSAPTSQPTAAKKGQGPAKSNLKKYTDEEIDSWCTICNDDATVRCNGCDGELYCAKCWKEGHVGPDVGYEERLHRWVKFTRDRKSAS